jgi:hypothetical protein
MQRFKSSGQDQRILASYGPMVQHFQRRRHRLYGLEYRQAIRIWV